MLTAMPLKAQKNATGDWEGLLNAGSRKIKIILHTREDNGTVKSAMDSPDQGAVNIPLAETVIKGDSLIITDKKMGLTIAGLYNSSADSIYGSFIQRGGNIKINFGRSLITGFKLNRPQTPKPPFPYKSEEVYFVNKKANSIRLAGTLTIPDGRKNPPVAVLISGSGPQNRNEKGFDHEPFLILSDYLSRNGIAVLRFDDRGVAQSEGDFSKATSYDFSTDAEAAVEYLKTRNDIDTKKIGLIGHSEGGLIAPMTAARDKDVAFVISLAGPAVTIDNLMLKQIEELAKSEKRPAKDIEKLLNMNREVFGLIKDIKDDAQLEKGVREVLLKYNHANGDKGTQDAFVKRCLSPWFRYFISYNPAPALEEVKCPLLAINGTLDKQVDAEMNLTGMKNALERGKNRDFTVNYLPGLNHAFQEAKTGDVSEYRLIEQTMSLTALNTIVKWINERF